MKLLNTSDETSLVKQCQEQFNFTLPSVALQRRRTKFMHKRCWVDFFTWSGRSIRSLHQYCHCISIVFFYFVFFPLLFMLYFTTIFGIKTFKTIRTKNEPTSSQRSKRPPRSSESGTLICHWKSNSFAIWTIDKRAVTPSASKLRARLKQSGGGGRPSRRSVTAGSPRLTRFEDTGTIWRSVRTKSRAPQKVRGNGRVFSEDRADATRSRHGQRRPEKLRRHHPSYARFSRTDPEIIPARSATSTGTATSYNPSDCTRSCEEPADGRVVSDPDPVGGGRGVSDGGDR